MGYKEVTGPSTQAENPAWTRWNQGLPQQEAGPQPTPGTPEWFAWLQRLPSLGRGPEPERYITTPGATSIEAMTMDEKIAAMSPAEKAAYQQSMRKLGLDMYGNRLTEEQIRAEMSPAELREEETQQAAYKSYMLSMGLNPETGARMTEAELLESMTPLQRRQYQQEQSDYAISMRGKGYNPETGARLTEAEMLAGMTEADRRAYEINKLSQEREKKGLEGTLPISPALETELAQEEKSLRAILQQKLGPNYLLSTAGQKAMSNLRTKNSLIREEARRGEISASGARTATQANTALQKSAAATGNYASSLAGVLQKSTVDRGSLLTNVTPDYAPINQGIISNLANVSNRFSGAAGNVMGSWENQQNLNTSAAMQSAANRAAALQGRRQVAATAAAAAASY
jgi:hypothetical protein